MLSSTTFVRIILPLDVLCRYKNLAFPIHSEGASREIMFTPTTNLAEPGRLLWFITSKPAGWFPRLRITIKVYSVLAYLDGISGNSTNLSSGWHAPWTPQVPTEPPLGSSVHISSQNHLH